jgi:hypothetical protein
VKRTRTSAVSHEKEDDSEEEEEYEEEKRQKKKPKTLYEQLTNPAERSLKTWVESVVGSSGVGGSGSSQTTKESEDSEGKKRSTKRNGDEGERDGISFFRTYETIPHYRGKTLPKYQRLDPSGDDLDSKLELYVSPGVLSAIITVYSHYRRNPQLKRLTLRDLIFGTDINNPIPHTTAQDIFRSAVIQFFREERFNNSQRMRSVAGARIQGMITAIIARNYRDSCGNHYQ